MTDGRLTRDAVLRVGEVTGVSGRRVLVTVDKEKNLSELFYDGDILVNVAVGSFIEIRKGFLSLIGKVEGENASFDSVSKPPQPIAGEPKRVLTVTLVGFLERSGSFKGGTKELPLVGNEAFLLTREKVLRIYSLSKHGDVALCFASTESEGYDVEISIDRIMNSHIAIFGNTGSGKSNTLAQLYRSFIHALQSRNRGTFESNCNVIVFDFNGEYTGEECLTRDKRVYHLSTRNNSGDRIPLPEDGLLDLEVLSILSDATEKTQKPFLRRVLSRRQFIMSRDNPIAYTRKILQRMFSDVLRMSDKIRSDQMLDYFKQILPEEDPFGDQIDIEGDLEWFGSKSQWKLRSEYTFFAATPEAVERTAGFGFIELFSFPDDIVEELIAFCYIQLIDDILANRAQNDFISPVIGRLRSKQRDINLLFDQSVVGSIFQKNIVVVSLENANLEMRKTIPLLISKRIYQDHKAAGRGKSLNIVIDEAHNILSHESFREAESWKDYRLETFEEIIKEGRKYGVFVTISSQRPNDISQTIISQAHNYFIHRLINDRDLQAIANAVSYIDRISEESIPTLPTGVCIFSGIATQMPLKLVIAPLPEAQQPRSATLEFLKVVAQSPDAN